MTNTVTERLQQSQLESWRAGTNTIVAWFARFHVDATDVYRHVVTNTDYDTAQAVCYLLSKMDKAVKLCDFLDTLERDNNEDVDVIKIYLLISHAEIALKSLGGKGGGRVLVPMFFVPVASDLQYRIKPTLATVRALAEAERRKKSKWTPTPVHDAAFILYMIRCEYTHEGNYTGKIFKKDGAEADGNLFRYQADEMDCFGECGVTYGEFLEIYMKALIENVKRFSHHPDPVVAGEQLGRDDAFMTHSAEA